MKKVLKESFSGREDDVIHREIVDVFFKKSSRDYAQKLRTKKRKKVVLLVTITTFLSLAFLGIIIILYRQRGPHNNRQPVANAFHYSESIIKDGQINRVDVEEAYFEGDAKEKSSFINDSIKLVNSGEYGRAALTIIFRDIKDAGGKNILILGRTEHGTKRINLIFKDDQNRFYEFPHISFSPNWNMCHIYLDEKKYFDLKKIKEIKLEFGSHTAGNEENATVYIKNITIRGSHETQTYGTQ